MARISPPASGVGGAVTSVNSRTGAVTGLAEAADVAPLSVSTNAQTASYTLVLADAGKVIEYNSSSAGNITIPPNSSVAFAVGTVIEICAIGTGMATAVAGSGVTLRAPDGAVTNEQYGSIFLRKRATDEWICTAPASSGGGTTKYTRYTGGDISLGTTTGSWINLQNALDITLPAKAGDVIECALSLYAGNGATEVWLDVVTIVSSSPVSSLANGGAATSSPPFYGVPSWRLISGVNDKTGGPARMTLVSGDISGGNVTLRVRYTIGDAVARTVFASSNYFIQFQATNLGASA